MHAPILIQPRLSRTPALAAAALALSLAGGAGTAPAQTDGVPNICRRVPVTEIGTALGLTLQRASALQDRLGEFVRTVCNHHADSGDSVDIIEWTRADGQAMPAPPRNAADCDLTCIQAGREPNLYAYVQRQYATATCVIRQPRRDRDVNAGPLTACYGTAGGRRRIVAVQRQPGAEPAPIERVKLAFDRVAAAR